MERTLVLLKPDCVQRRLMGRILARFEEKGLNIVAMKLMRVTPELARRHYAEHVEKAWYPNLEGFITGGPIVAAIVEGLEAIRVVRDMVGATSGLNAATGTIRGDFSSSQQMNLLHASAMAKFSETDTKQNLMNSEASAETANPGSHDTSISYGNRQALELSRLASTACLATT